MAVVVVSHNSENDLEGCREALAYDERVGALVVIDNASIDDSVVVARMAGGDHVEVVALDENTGVAGGCNRGYGEGCDQAGSIAFMNPGVRVEQECFDRCTALMEASQCREILVPVLNRLDGAMVDGVGWVLD